MRTRKKRAWKKIVRIGELSVFRHRTDPHRFEVSWKKRDGGYGRRRFSAQSTEQAIGQARVAAGLSQSQPIAPDEPFEIQQAFETALAQTRRGPSARKDWLRDQVRFLEWLERTHPHCGEWSALTRPILRQFAGDLHPPRTPGRLRCTTDKGFSTTQHQTYSAITR